jgi:hypothetical protein
MVMRLTIQEATSFLHAKGIEAIIPPRENSSTLSRGSPDRAKTVRRIRRTGCMEEGSEVWKAMEG